MSPEQDEFKDLRRLLALKRHEQPPPGYFDQFSRQVILCIKAGEKSASVFHAETHLFHLPWFQSLWGALQAKPVLAGVFSLAVCGLVVTGINMSERSQGTPVSVLPVPDQSIATLRPDDQPTAGLLTQTPETGSPSSEGTLTLQTTPSLFQQAKEMQKPWYDVQAQPASFAAPRGN
jgi:hypothetical protein